MKNKRSLKAEEFLFSDNLIKFINENKIRKEDILTITEGPKFVAGTTVNVFTLFYWD